ncbi:restriction endonuclease subunit S [Elizabethkingia anophelis]|nr:restriction endonuclease subunit S [Elizabethkingia anophelis]
MSEIEKLLDGVEVEWKPLEELATITIGEFVHQNNQDKSAEFPVYNGGISPTGYYDEFNNSGNKIIVSARGANAGFVNRITKPYWAGNSCYSVGIKDTSKLDWLFVYYFLKGNENKIIGSQQKGGIPAVSKKQMEVFQIPIPPLEIQQKIVDILDKFTELTAELTTELTTELTARKQQYDYYREELFAFDENEVQHLPLGDENTGKFIRGGGLQKKDFTETGVGCIHYGQIYTYYGTYTNKTKSFVSEDFAKKARMAKHGDLIIATTSENDEDVCKAVAWIGEEQIAVSSDACFYTHKLNPKFVAYFFQTEQFQKQKRPFITGSKVRRVNAGDLAKIRIPVPSLEEQERIVSILDKFDILTNSISEGLSKEVELRKKQYEYYRDMLLTFPKDNIEA